MLSPRRRAPKKGHQHIIRSVESCASPFRTLAAGGVGSALTPPATLWLGVPIFLRNTTGLAHSTSPVDGSYSGTKWMVEAMSKSMAQAFQSPHATPAHLVASGVGPNIICVPLAPGVLQTEMNPGGGDLDGWIKVAVPFMLKLGLDDSGRSLTMPGYYAKNYMVCWRPHQGTPRPTGGNMWMWRHACNDPPLHFA